MINISELLDDPFFTEPHRVGKTTRNNVNGKPVESVEWHTIIANSQPVGDEALQQLAEGERFKPKVQFFTNAMEVNVGDYLEIGDKKYRAMTEGDFNKYGYSDNIFTLYSGVEDNENDGFTPPWG